MSHQSFAERLSVDPELCYLFLEHFMLVFLIPCKWDHVVLLTVLVLI